MYRAFDKISDDKKNAIIDAALREFVAKGYEGASTNNIVKEAGISKGILFHYFQNKKGLFLYVYDYCIEILKTEIFSKADSDERDILERIKRWTMMKMEAFEEHPEVFQFITKSIIDLPAEVAAEISSRMGDGEKEGYRRLLDDIDYTLFKEGIEINRVMKIILWTINNLSDEMMADIKEKGDIAIDFDYIKREVNAYMEVFRQSFYKS